MDEELPISESTKNALLAVTPVEQEERRGWAKLWLVVFAVLAALVIWLFQRYAPDEPVKFSDIEDHFKYGSIGSDVENGLPFEIMRVLPGLFPQYLPKGAPHDYTAFGFIQEPGHKMPIGFSLRRQIIDKTGLNCAACHTGVYRETEDSEARMVLGMPSNTVNLQAFLEFLFRCAEDPNFTPDYIIPAVSKNFFYLPVIDDLIYTQAISQMKAGILLREVQVSSFLTPDHPPFGPGRVDTFNPYKVNQFAYAYNHFIPPQERLGSADFPSIWNQLPREGMHLHWDGNNTSVEERNISAALGAGATREHVDLKSIERTLAWLKTMPPPKLPYEPASDAQKLNRGKEVFSNNCASCHSFGGAKVGAVEPIENVGTDRGRLDSYTEKLHDLQVAYTRPYPWAFTHFQKTNGYANQPLDGVWARAPYLHNGSVPSIGDLLKPANTRPKKFFVGHGVLDKVNLGIRADVEKTNGKSNFQYDTTLPGNSNEGHSGPGFGTELSEDDKAALVEYMKTL